MAILCYRKEMMRSLGRTNGIHRDSNVAIGAIFESNRTRKRGGELPVNLTFRRPRPDGSPRDEICNILGRNHVEELGARRHTVFVKLEQQMTSDLQPFIDMKTAVKLGVVE